MANNFDSLLVKEVFNWWLNEGMGKSYSSCFTVAPYRGKLIVIAGVAAIILEKDRHPFDKDTICDRWKTTPLSEEQAESFMPPGGECSPDCALTESRLYEKVLDKRKTVIRVFKDSSGVEYHFDDNILKKLLYHSGEAALFTYGIGKGEGKCYLCRHGVFEPYGIIMPLRKPDEYREQEAD